MSRSRWGGFLRGKLRYTEDWNLLKTPESTGVPAPDSPLTFDYTTAQGIWNLNSTIQFRGNGDSGGGTPTYTLGLSTSLDSVTGQLDGWKQRNVNISAYAGATVRLVFHYVSGSSYTGDLQIDAINISGTQYSFEADTHSFEVSVSGEATYGSVNWQAMGTAETGGRWCRDTGGTGSGSTARADAANGSYYIYTETSSPGYPSYNFWVRSPQITLGSSPTLTYYEARLGATIGTLNVHLDVIA